MPIRIIIADDHEVFRIGLRFSLEQHGNVEVLAEATNGEQLLSILEYKTPDIVLLDLNMPGLDGLQTLEKIVKRNQIKKVDVKVLIVSAHDSESYIVQAVEEGACGFLSKQASTSEIILAVDSVMANGIYFSEKVNKLLVHKLVKRKKLNPVFDTNNVAFSSSELSVLKLLCREMTSSEIAKQLSLSPRSAEDIRYQLFKKTGVKNAVGLALWAVKNGIIDL